MVSTSHSVVVGGLVDFQRNKVRLLATKEVKANKGNLEMGNRLT